jgi:putative aminopeptidase FrvX
MASFKIDVQDMLDFLVGLLNTPSPTGFHEQAAAYCQQAFANLPCSFSTSRKGELIGTWNGQDDSRPRALTAHIDTLGAMVTQIADNGRLKLTQLGGWAWGSVEGEGVTVFTRSGKRFRGSIMPVKASIHVFGEAARNFERKPDAYEVRLDARTRRKKETLALEIDVGDYVAFDPRVEVGDAGFIRSRHLDDKAGVACIYGAVKALSAANLMPARRTTIHISNYEEVGHGGASGFPDDLHELVAVDMAVVGPEQNCDEFSVGICAKDNQGPYHIDLVRRLIHLAEDNQIPLKVGTYPYYGSDGEAYWFAGGEAAVGLIGPGVDASHHYERTHIDGLVAAAELIGQYLLST